jgi:hypothetical protein
MATRSWVICHTLGLGISPKWGCSIFCSQIADASGLPPWMPVDTFRDMTLSVGRRRRRKEEHVDHHLDHCDRPRFDDRCTRGELVLEQTCDGWRTARTALNVSSFKPETWRGFIFPICWGRRHDDCRIHPASRSEVTFDDVGPSFSVTYHVDCKDKATGALRAASTATVTALTRASGRQRHQAHDPHLARKTTI